MAREVVKTVTSVWTNEGKGVKVRRSIGRPEVFQSTSLYFKFSRKETTFIH